MKHDELAQSLAAHLMAAQDGPMVWTDMQLGPSGSPRPDVYCIPKTYTALRPMIYEVKVSVSDFRADVTAGKWQSYRPMCSGIYFAFPDSLAVLAADVPAECGIIKFNASTGKWRAARKPVLRPIDNLPTKVWQKLLIDGVGRAHKAWEPVAANEYKALRALEARLGEEVGKYLRDSMEARRELDQITAGNHYKLEQARVRAEGAVKTAKQDAERELYWERQSFDNQLRATRTALGLPVDAPADQIVKRMRDALALMAGEVHAVARARVQLEAANEALANVEAMVTAMSQTQGEKHA